MTEAEQMGSLCERYPVGSETDALVEIHVFGQDMAAGCSGELSDIGEARWECSECGAWGQWGENDDPHPRVPRRFTRDERPARLVMEAMAERLWLPACGISAIDFATYLAPLGEPFHVTHLTWRATMEPAAGQGGGVIRATAPTMPHAAALAALLALGAIKETP